MYLWAIQLSPSIKVNLERFIYHPHSKWIIGRFKLNCSTIHCESGWLWYFASNEWLSNLILSYHKVNNWATQLSPWFKANDWAFNQFEWDWYLSTSPKVNYWAIQLSASFWVNYWAIQISPTFWVNYWAI